MPYEEDKLIPEDEDWRDNTFEINLMHSVLRRLESRLENERDPRKSSVLTQTIATVKNTILELSF